MRSKPRGEQVPCALARGVGGVHRLALPVWQQVILVLTLCLLVLFLAEKLHSAVFTQSWPPRLLHSPAASFRECLCAPAPVKGPFLAAGHTLAQGAGDIGTGAVAPHSVHTAGASPPFQGEKGLSAAVQLADITQRCLVLEQSACGAGSRQVS